MPHVVILGGSFAGCNAVKTLYSLAPDLELTLISSSSHAYFNCAAPRLLVEPETLEKTLFSLDTFVQKHSKGRGRFVQGTATKANLEKKEIEVDATNGNKTITYDYLVIATGTKSSDKGFKVNQSHEEASEAILDWGKKIKAAETIGILGGGPTGVESAGEIAHDLKKKVTVYTGDKEPLSVAKLGKGTQDKLEKLGVEVINNVRYKEIIPQDSGASRVVFDNGSERTFDVILNTTLYVPFSDFLPDEVKNDKGFVNVDDRLVVKGFPEVFALGDIVAGAAQSIVDLKFGQLPVFAATAKADIFGQETKSISYSPVRSTIIVPISRKGGEGRLFGWHIPSFAVWLIKARTFMVDKASGDFA
ncbi:hypothetical protein FT663_00147 [Candidozyma haemuli var. vulneris]|uniref:FAD/NAD(P)-binding domain-containing protein n=1 Tax=Candidozyma haemuli TaxID=45357 RepID=A0A2V1AM31_9ASCO|nr:hypothetical protein CXQ85_001060 [[Candida] haemuloni]KAF3994177.1 hypothetical protein FT662_00046 [[Candida] haemuloni var. vulneris]KAF3995725.1 hypothetical protein FT663_00147 [[Candida] haemuloni var. vulneris]PVH18772.1 hypothetical protein CXQ85_001060 [[Candida] haemuloni]